MKRLKYLWLFIVLNETAGLAQYTQQYSECIGCMECTGCGGADIIHNSSTLSFSYGTAVDFVSNDVSSDFGPRRTYNWHGGIDYYVNGINNRGNAIIVLAIAIIRNLDAGGIKDIALQGSHFSYGYRHIFHGSGLPPAGGMKSGAFVIKKVDGVSDNSFSNITIYETENKIYVARRKLSTENALVEQGGTGDFHAGLEVELKPGFEAETGSETVVYCANAGPFCNLSPSYKSNSESQSNLGETQRREILISYQTHELETMTIVPNPAYGFIYIITSNGCRNYEIYNALGSRISFGALSSAGRTRVEVSGLVPGMYTVRVGCNSVSESKTIIIHKNKLR